MIRKAKIKDVDAIFRIAEENKLNDDNVKQGFLVSDFSRLDYLTKIEALAHFYVIECEKKIVGFTFLYQSHDMDMSLKVNQNIKKASQGKFLIIKQVAIAKSHQHLGMGREIYDFLFRQFDCDFFTAIVSEPKNQISIDFHLKTGFEKIADVLENDGLPREIYFVSRASIVDLFDKDLLLEQYKLAMDVYQHEDNLNWSKISGLFYITTGLAGATGLFISQGSEQIRTIVLIIAAIGFLISLLFSITIDNGVEYFSNRKESLIEIETILKKFKAVDLISPKLNHQRIMKRSMTTYIIRLIPKILAFLWLCAFVIVLFI